MGAELLEVKDFVRNWKAELKSEVAAGRAAGRKPPTLTIIQVGNNPASTKYVDNKIKDCKEVGIQVDLFRIPENSGIDQAGLEDIVYNCETNGLLIQLPLPDYLNADKALEYTTIWKDVDGFIPGSPYSPATAKGIIKFLEGRGLGDGSGKNALVIGRSKIVGRPVAKMLLDRNWTVTVAHSKSPDLWQQLLGKQLIVCAVGKAEFLDLRQVPAGCTVIDVGTNFVDGKLVGDCFAHGEDNARCAVTPVPGGVGLLTRAALLENVVEAWNNQNENLEV